MMELFSMQTPIINLKKRVHKYFLHKSSLEIFHLIPALENENVLDRFSEKKFRFCHGSSSNIKSLKNITVAYGHLDLSKLTCHLLSYQPVLSFENRNITGTHCHIPLNIRLH